MPVVIVLLVLIVLAELFLLMLRCRREHPGWKLLRQYRYGKIQVSLYGRAAEE